SPPVFGIAFDPSAQPAMGRPDPATPQTAAHQTLVQNSLIGWMLVHQLPQGRFGLVGLACALKIEQKIFARDFRLRPMSLNLLQMDRRFDETFVRLAATDLGHEEMELSVVGPILKTLAKEVGGAGEIMFRYRPLNFGQGLLMCAAGSGVIRDCGDNQGDSRET